MFTHPDIIYDYIYPKIKGKIIKSNELNTLYNFFSDVKVLPYEEIERSFSSETFSSDYELTYTSEKIKRQIKDFDMKYRFVLSFPNMKVYINIYTKERLTNLNFIDELYRYISFIASINPIKKEITINYHLSSDKKFVKTGILTKNEVNSGSCLSGNEKCTINIWRKEELLKVTLHELSHGLEHSDYNDSSDLIEHYNSKYNTTSKKINSHEAYTEIWANLINCFLISQKYKRSKEEFKKLVTIEKFYAIFQAQKVLYNSHRMNIDLDRDTNVTAYFLIRAELYQRLNGFLKFCRVNNENYVKLKNTNQWLVFLKSKIKVKKNGIFNKQKNSYLFKNLRMTILELDVLP